MTFKKRSGPFVAFFALALMVFGPQIGNALTTDQRQVIEVTVSAVQARSPKASVTPSVSEIAIVGSYALTTWLFGEGGGQAVLHKKNNGVWSVIGIGGGEMASSTLVSFGVPGATAHSLERTLRTVPTPMPSKR